MLNRAGLRRPSINFRKGDHSNGKWSESRSVMSESLQPHGLYSPWNSPGQNAGVGSLSLLQGIFPTQGSNPGLPHCRWILCQLSYQRSPRHLWKWTLNQTMRSGFWHCTTKSSLYKDANLAETGIGLVQFQGHCWLKRPPLFADKSHSSIAVLFLWVIVCFSSEGLCPWGKYYSHFGENYIVISSE